MNGHPNAEHDELDGSEEEFARQLAAVLRASEEHPGSDFDDRVMSAVRAVHALTPVTPIPGWRKRRTLALPPMAWGVLAAGFAIIVSLGTLATAHLLRSERARAVAAAPVPARIAPRVAPQVAPLAPAAPVQSPSATRMTSTQPTAPVAPTRRDTVYMVRFVLADADAHTVTLVGDFNDWAKHANPLRPAKAGVWSTQVALTPGRHEYAFVVDGKRWVADPSADHVADEFDTPSSVVNVGSGRMGGK